MIWLFPIFFMLAMVYYPPAAFVVFVLFFLMLPRMLAYLRSSR